MNDAGRGTFEYPLPHTPDETRTVAVPFALPGDTIDATFVKRDKGSWIGRLHAVTSKSPDRVDAPCPHAGVCGGCLWQSLAYPAQLTLKRDMINAAFAKAGHDERVTEVVGSPTQFHHRNRMDFAIGWKGEVGLKEYGAWNRYLDLSTCLLLDEETPRIFAGVRTILETTGLVPWDAKRYEGDLRYCIIRRGINTNERMITLLVKDLARVTDAMRETIKDTLSPFATTLYLGENPEITDLSLAKTLVLLQGKPMLEERVNDIQYQIHPNSFFQTNTSMAGVLQEAVLRQCGPLSGKKLLDLYCGLGFFGIAAATKGADVYGHELDAPAIELARVNAKANGVADRCRFGAGPVEAFDWSAERPDVVIVDPPRAGLHPKALKMLVDQAPNKIVYVSCSYHRLVNELKTLKETYTVSSLHAFDLFPHTPHVEVVATLDRRAETL